MPSTSTIECLRVSWRGRVLLGTLAAVCWQCYAAVIVDMDGLLPQWAGRRGMLGGCCWLCLRGVSSACSLEGCCSYSGCRHFGSTNGCGWCLASHAHPPLPQLMRVACSTVGVSCHTTGGKVWKLLARIPHITSRPWDWIASCGCVVGAHPHPHTYASGM
jgi:hypothetical protein